MPETLLSKERQREVTHCGKIDCRFCGKKSSADKYLLRVEVHIQDMMPEGTAAPALSWRYEYEIHCRNPHCGRVYFETRWRGEEVCFQAVQPPKDAASK